MALDVVPHQDLDNKALETPPTLQDKTEVDKKAALLGFSHEQPTTNMEEVDYESLPTDKLLPHLLAGGAAGVMEHCTMYPVDCVKTRMMTLFPDPKARYKNLHNAFYEILTKENYRVLFRGMGVVATGAGPAHALYFSCYEYAKNALTLITNGNNVLAQGAAGAIASVVHDGFMNPIEVVKQRLQMYHTPYRGAFDCIRTVYFNEGTRAFYRSYTTQLSMNIPFQVVHFISYESLQDIFNNTRHYNPLSHMLSGAGAGAFAAAITNPLDVAKTLLNTHEQRRTVSRERRIRGMLSALVKIYRVRGLSGYFRGITARVVYQVPSTAICWSVYEFFKHCLGLKEQNHSSKAEEPPSQI